MLELKSHTSEKVEIFCERIVPTDDLLAEHDGQKIYDQIGFQPRSKGNYVISESWEADLVGCIP